MGDMPHVPVLAVGEQAALEIAVLVDPGADHFAVN